MTKITNKTAKTNSNNRNSNSNITADNNIIQIEQKIRNNTGSHPRKTLFLANLQEIEKSLFAIGEYLQNARGAFDYDNGNNNSDDNKPSQGDFNQFMGSLLKMPEQIEKILCLYDAIEITHKN